MDIEPSAPSPFGCSTPPYFIARRSRQAKANIRPIPMDECMYILSFSTHVDSYPCSGMRFRVSNVVCRCTHRHAHTRRPRPGVRVRVRVRPVVCHGQPSFREVKVSGEKETSVTRECCVPTLVVGPGTDEEARERPSFPRRPTRHECHSCVSVGLVVAETDAEGGRTSELEGSRTSSRIDIEMFEVS